MCGVHTDGVENVNEVSSGLSNHIFYWEDDVRGGKMKG